MNAIDWDKVTDRELELLYRHGNSDEIKKRAAAELVQREALEEFETMIKADPEGTLRRYGMC